jgi:predicted nucleic acid-binding protein
MMISATALEHSLALMTENRKDFPLPDLTFSATLSGAKRWNPGQ